MKDYLSSSCVAVGQDTDLIRKPNLYLSYLKWKISNFDYSRL